MTFWYFLLPLNMVENIAISRLLVYEFNPRDITDTNFEKLIISLTRDPEFMTMRPCLVNKTKKGFFVYAGAQRLKACKSLGWETVPCIVDNDLPDSIIKTRMLKDNIHYGNWDLSKLSEFDTELLNELDLSSLGALDLGKSEEAYDGILNGQKPKDEKLPVFRFVFSNKKEKESFGEFLLSLSQVTQKSLADLLTNG